MDRPRTDDPQSAGVLGSNVTPTAAESGAAEAGVGIEPTVGAAYSHAWSILKADFWTLLLIGFVAWLLGGLVSSLLGRVGGGNAAGGALSGLYQLLVGTPISFGAAYAWLRAVRGTKPTVSDLFVPFQRQWLTCVIAGLLLEIIVVVGFILLIIPGIFLAVRLSLVPFLVVDEGWGPVQALTESFRRTSGHFWQLVGAFLLGIVVVIVGFILLIVGSIPAIMLVYLAFASLYAAITARDPKSTRSVLTCSKMADPETIHNWRRLDDRITTSGQPTESQLAGIRALGVRHIVNLGLHTHPKALPDEAASVIRLGMEYIHIPVDFQNPTDQDFEQFCSAMEHLKDVPVHVHCIANYRVSAFFYRYRRDVLGMDASQARAEMEAIWNPEGVWAAFVDG